MPRPAKNPEDQPKRARKPHKAPTEPDLKRRNPVVPEWDAPFGDAVRKLREAKGWSQWELALELKGPDGKPHPMVAHTVTRFEREGLTKQVRHQLSKAVSRIENHEQAPTVNLAKAFADALGVESGALLDDLRHFGGTQTAISGATLREIQARLGHASPAAAMRYQHAAERRGKQTAEALGAAWVEPTQAPNTVRKIRRA